MGGGGMALSHLLLSDLEMSKSRSLRLQRLVSGKGVRVKSYVDFQISNFKALCLVKEPFLLALNVNKKPYMGSHPMAPLHLILINLESSESRSLRLWVVRDMHIDGSIIMWMSHKGICGLAGFSTVLVIFLVCVCFLSCGLPFPSALSSVAPSFLWYYC